MGQSQQLDYEEYKNIINPALLNKTIILQYKLFTNVQDFQGVDYIEDTGQFFDMKIPTDDSELTEFMWRILEERQQITIGNIIGQGQFAKVFQVLIDGSYDEYILRILFLK